MPSPARNPCGLDDSAAIVNSGRGRNHRSRGNLARDEAAGETFAQGADDGDGSGAAGADDRDADGTELPSTGADMVGAVVALGLLLAGAAVLGIRRRQLQ